MILSGCGDETNHITNYIVDNSLSDPNVQPKIVFTKPANGAVGPFANYDRYDNQPNPKFTIQLNKLINILEIGPDAITLTTDDFVYPIDLYGYSDGDLDGDPNLRHILLFRSSGYKYLANKEYTVTVDTILEDIHGYRLSEPYIFSFIPEPEFRVYYGYPTYDDVSPFWFNIYIDFNSQVDITIFDKLNISPPIEGEWLVYSWDSTSAEYISDDTLMYDTEYTISVAADARDVNGLLIKEPYQFSFKTEPFEVRLSGYSGHIGPGGFNVYNNFRFEFNGYVDTSTVRQAFSVNPSLSFDIIFEYSGSGQYDGFRIMFDEYQMQPSTTYTMKVDSTVRSVSGVYIKEPYFYSFKTGAL
jgi:hypothetical protein